MNNKQKPKINLFFGGLAEKHKENNEYFIAFEFELFSGSKSYKGYISKDENEAYTLSFSGEKSFESFAAALLELEDLIMKYDSAIIQYIERALISEITIDDKNIKLSNKKTEFDFVPQSNLKNKKYNISIHKAKDLLYELGYTTADGKLKNDMVRKYKQTDRFIELIGNLFDDEKNITIVDCACGKSYLSFVLNYWLWEEKRIKAKFYGLDISENVIEESKKTAERLAYTNMEFIKTDLSQFSGTELEKRIRPDAVISLHACDTATDMAIGYGIKHNAKNIICVPCCHKELLDKYSNDTIAPIAKHGIFRTRFNDILTDALRSLKLEACGYEVSCVEYCSPLDTPKNLLIKAKKIANANKKAEEEYRAVLKNFKVKPAIEIYSSKDDFSDSIF